MIRVLVVEDESLIAAAHRTYLGRLDGFVVVGEAHTASAALRAVAELDVDLVLLDLGLPDANGIEVCTALRRRRPSPDVIAITAARDLAVVRAAVASGVLLYLIKPFTFAAFRDKLERYLDYRRALPPGEVAVSQRDVDQAMSALRSTDDRTTSPKGVAPATLEQVAAAVRHSTAGLSAAEAGEAVGVSRVTAWRYLERLAEQRLVEGRTEYGRAGRPRVRYHWQPARRSEHEPQLKGGHSPPSPPPPNSWTHPADRADRATHRSLWGW